jgi:hypothetical protein
VLELFFESLLVGVSLLIAWFAIYVIVKLFKGQN